MMTLEEFKTKVHMKWEQLSLVGEKYLSEAGQAAMAAYRDTLYHIEFVDSIAELRDWEVYKNLILVNGKHTEYYKVMGMLHRVLENN